MKFLRDTGLMKKLNRSFRKATKILFDSFLENNKYLEYQTFQELEQKQKKERKRILDEEEKERYENENNHEKWGTNDSFYI